MTYYTCVKQAGIDSQEVSWAQNFSIIPHIVFLSVKTALLCAILLLHSLSWLIIYRLYKNILSTYYTPTFCQHISYINIVFVTLFVHVSLLLSTFTSSFAGWGYTWGPADLLQFLTKSTHKPCLKSQNVLIYVVEKYCRYKKSFCL